MPRFLAVLVALAFVVAVAPTLAWLEFSSGGENLLVSTVIEMRATQQRLTPTLNGEKRVRKPPLAAWAAEFALPETVTHDLSRAAPGAPRDWAYQRLAVWLRLPAVVISAIIIVLIYQIAAWLLDTRTGILAAVVAASSLLLLRYGRAISTDIHLTLWVTLANLALIRVLVGGRASLWLLIAGAAAGLGFLSKGPVALLMIAPVLLALFIRRRKVNVAPVAGGVIALIAVAAPWFVYVWWKTPGAWQIWWTEISRQGATAQKPDPWFSYASVFAMMAPWTVMFIAGIALAIVHRRRESAGWLPLLMILLPVVVMSLVKDKNERYLLPLIGPASILCAQALAGLIKPWGQYTRVERLTAGLHWGLAVALSIGVSVSGAIAQVQPDGRAWWGWPIAVILAVIFCAAAVLAMVLSRRRAVMLPVTTALLMLAVHTVFLQGYRNSLSGRSEMKPIADDIAALRPAASVIFHDTKIPPKPLPQDLQIYVNRVVRFVADPARLPPPSRDVVVVMQRRENQPEPSLPGYHEIARQPWGRRAWHAFSGD